MNGKGLEGYGPNAGKWDLINLRYLVGMDRVGPKGTSFFWLVSLLLSSLLWFVAVQLSNKANAGVQHGLLMMGAGASVLLQEAFRFAYYKLL
eukprot:g38862.t1